MAEEFLAVEDKTLTVFIIHISIGEQQHQSRSWLDNMVEEKEKEKESKRKKQEKAKDKPNSKNGNWIKK